jgi:hypothetical protein
MLTLRKQYTIFVTALLMTVAQVPSWAQSNDTAAPSTSAKLADLNMGFISLYRAQNPAVLAQLPLIVIINYDGVIAIEPTKRTQYAFSPGHYEMKTALHAVLAYQGLMNELTESNSTLTWGDADRFSDSLVELTSLIPKTQASTAAQQGATAVISKLQQATRTAIAQQKVTTKDIALTLSSVEPEVMAVNNEIGQSIINAMIATLKAIEEKVTPSIWEKVIVVVPGPATARVNNLGLAAAATVLGKSALGKQIFYSEAIYDDEGILRFVQMLMRDKHFSTLMFDQPYRMWRDVLSETSEKYLNENTGAQLAR